jgi:ferrochelatase
MKQEGIRRALGFVTSAYSSYSSCRQYRADIVRAQAEVGPGAPEIDKLRAFFNHPLFVESTIDRLRDALRNLPMGTQEHLQVVYTAHSIPLLMADTSDYVKQLEEVRRMVSSALNIKNDALVYQSRSGAPGQPWLEPDILDHLREVKARSLASAVVLAPIGFLSDHLEVLYDLDVEARRLCESLNLPMARMKTVGVHPKFIAMIRELILERMHPESERRSIGSFGSRPDACPKDCCPA